ncbi:subclass B3 metallo-beta-lactamase [Sphingomonas gilva]|nr:subclass B3 metallo-beta-lactamase [Sphingomonas gilva]
MLAATAACTPEGELANAAPGPADVAQIEAPQPLLESWVPWNAPQRPFKIAGDLYYVGAKNVSAYAVKTPDGIILIDTGFAQTLPQIEANLKTLGMDISDVKIILTSHAHADHVGGVAALKAKTGARLVASEADAALMAAGGRGDFTWGDDLAYPRVRADRIVGDRETVELGGAVLTAHVTPGHTKGCTTWTMKAGGADVVVLCGTSAPGYDLVDNAAYPGIAEDYAASFDRMASLPCDIVLAGHIETIGLAEKAASGALVDPAACKKTIADARAAFEKELARQRAGGAPDES